MMPLKRVEPLCDELLVCTASQKFVQNSTAGDHSVDILLVRSVRAIILIVFIVGPFIGLWNV
jgi:hypothetical protein